MDYVAKITTEHSTYTAENPKKTVLHVTAGRMVGGWISFPTGPAGLLHAVVCRGIYQILPSNQGGNYAMANCVVPFFCNVDIVSHPLFINVYTWNDSTAYDHALTICIFIDPLAKPLPKMSWLSRMLGKT